jgi:dTDP-4-amino-4,6-dideoxygalactose transaminase
LGNGSIRPPARRQDAQHVFHQYVVRVSDRAEVQARLRAAGIGTGVHYPVAVHAQPAYRDRIAMGPACCAASEQASREVLSLPMYPELTDAQVEAVCTGLRSL